MTTHPESTSAASASASAPLRTSSAEPDVYATLDWVCESCLEMVRTDLWQDGKPKRVCCPVCGAEACVVVPTGPAMRAVALRNEPVVVCAECGTQQPAHLAGCWKCEGYEAEPARGRVIK